ncbi:hypothetical protein NIES4073_33930 [Kalymmatonema gypsitolerans NIES-4073]|nr:hypothetical protein NIES4073_33930 [Scytonema sp. NIES-4073]
MTSGTVCVDANFVVHLVGRGTVAARYINLWDSWQESAYTPVAPTLIYYEISNVFHRLLLAGQLLPEEADQSLEDAMSLNIRLYGDVELHTEALNLARSLRLPATYDAHYLALAQRLECEFWTSDRKLVNSVKPTLPWVKLVS